MLENNKGSIWLRILFVLLALGLLAAGAFFVFRVGVVRGTAGDFAGTGQMPMYQNWGHHYTPMMTGYHSFPLFQLFFGFIFLMFIFSLLRRAIFGPRLGWGMRGMHGMRGEFGRGRMEEYHAELHRRMEQEPAAADESAPGE